MKKIGVASGKGGAGKTCLTAALAVCSPEKWVVADCDVDAANLRILLDSRNLESEGFFSGKTAEINPEKCIRCGRCQNVCRFESIQNFQIQGMFCEGCGFCTDVCPVQAITLKENKTGMVFISETPAGLPLVHGELFPGEDNSGKLVTRVRQKAERIAKEKGRILLIDGPPGVGCPVIAALTGIDLLLLVAEASVSGFEDAKRLLNLAKHLKIPVAAVLNKTGLDPRTDKDLENFFQEKDIAVLESIPFDEELIELLGEKKTWMEGSGWIQAKIENIVEKIYGG